MSVNNTMIHYLYVKNNHFQPAPKYSLSMLFQKSDVGCVVFGRNEQKSVTVSPVRLIVSKDTVTCFLCC